MDMQRLLSTPGSSPSARSGVWTAEEDVYLAALIDAFVGGVLSAVPPATQLRGFLATELGCNPMRVSKKLGLRLLQGRPLAPRIGRRLYQACPLLHPDTEQSVLIHLNDLRRAFLVAVDVPSEPARVKPTVAGARGGSWTFEEQLYASKLIAAFTSGYVKARSGTTLRSFLARELQCCPMRVSKKLGSGVLLGHRLPPRLGRRAFVEHHPQTLEFDQKARRARRELRVLSKVCLTSVE
ncbi:hypothetical protein ACHHYP_17218 [Achlya hypogyna]|uniref:Uncharacterized protein n=1 Tax=Achlya hypogyna TaxID=1202772 RepID=A0A1V9Y507_ACHHY|nr:hypothetical protein ACHHYP_17218 [Achlya hypogyna]